MYDFELNKIKSLIIKNNPKTVLIQLPSGLRKHVVEIKRFIEKLGVNVLVWAGSCYGACDTPSYKTDLLIHFGHEEFTF